MANDVVVVVRSKDEASAVFDKVKGNANSLGNTLSSVGKIAAGFLTANVIQAGVGQLTTFLGGSKDAAVDLGESLNAVNVVFGSSAQKILDWGKTTASAYGLSNASFNQLVTPLGAMLQNYGFSADEAADQSINLAKRAADMASVFNVDVSEALSAIQAGLRGEADPLEKFGVGLNAAAIEGKALAMTGKDVAASLTDQEKKTAALALIMEQTDAVAGDFVNTSDSLANAARINAAEMENQQAAIGEKLLPAYKLWGEAKMAAVNFLANNLIPAIEKTSEWMGPKIAEAVQFWKTDVEPVIKDVSAIIAAEWAKFQVYYEQDIKPALDNVIAGVEAVIGYIQDNWPKIEAVIKPVMEAVLLIIESFFETVTGIINVFIQVLGGDFSEAWEAAKGVVQTQLDLIKGLLGNLLEFVAGLIPLLLQLGKDAMGALFEGLKALWNAEVKPFMESLPTLMVQALGEIATRFRNIGESVIRALADGVGNAGSYLQGVIKRLIEKYLNPTNWDIPFLSPFHEAFRHAGNLIVEHMADGMGERESAMFARVTELTEMLGESLGRAGTASGDEFLRALSYQLSLAIQEYENFIANMEAIPPPQPFGPNGGFLGTAGSGGAPGGSGGGGSGGGAGPGGSPVTINPNLGQVLNGAEMTLLSKILGPAWDPEMRYKPIDFAIRQANIFGGPQFMASMNNILSGMAGGGFSGQINVENFLGDLRKYGLQFDQGGWLPPGVSLAVNNTGRPEPILGPGQMGGVVININAIDGESVRRIAPQLAREIQTHLRGSGVVGMLA